MPIVIATLLDCPPENSETIEDVEEVIAAVETIVICVKGKGTDAPEGALGNTPPVRVDLISRLDFVEAVAGIQLAVVAVTK